ncbi:NAD(+) diphosphatase [Nocardioidaceae bacterium]|nr:NAD(+) diphosphatase [Nocardioidaceae bacterium]
MALAARPHDRIAHRRTDAAWLASAWVDPAARVLELRRDMLPTYAAQDGSGATRLAWRAAPTVDADEAAGRGAVTVLLGQRDGVTHLALLHPAPPEDDPPTDAGRPPAEWTTLRDVVQNLAEDDAALAVHAVGLAEWHRGTRFCARCGGGLDPAQAGHLLVCRQCRRHHFPRTDPAVIMLVRTGDGESERCLLGRHPGWPEGRYSTLAGFVEPGETCEDAVRREVAEETGVRVGDVRFEGDQPWPFPASLMVGFTATAESTEIAVDGEEIEDARWFTRRELEACATSGEVVLPGGVSISRVLIERWFGGELPGRW